jgi:hypothetical protein
MKYFHHQTKPQTTDVQSTVPTELFQILTIIFSKAKYCLKIVVIMFNAAHPVTSPMDTAGYFSENEVSGTWIWPQISSYCRGKENVEVYIHSPPPLFLHGVVLSWAQEQHYLLPSFMATFHFFIKSSYFPCLLRYVTLVLPLLRNWEPIHRLWRGMTITWFQKYPFISLGG